MTLKTSEKLAVTLLGLSIVQVVAATVALYYGLTLYFLVEVEVLSYASINYQLLPILIIGLATLAASNRFDFIRISLMLYFSKVVGFSFFFSKELDFLSTPRPDFLPRNAQHFSHS